MGTLGKKLTKRLRSTGIISRKKVVGDSSIIVTIPEYKSHYSWERSGKPVRWPCFKMFDNYFIIHVSPTLWEKYFYRDEVTKSMELARDFYDYLNCLKKKPKTIVDLDKVVKIFFDMTVKHKGFFE